MSRSITKVTGRGSACLNWREQFLPGMDGVPEVTRRESACLNWRMQIGERYTGSGAVTGRESTRLNWRDLFCGGGGAALGCYQARKRPPELTTSSGARRAGVQPDYRARKRPSKSARVTAQLPSPARRRKEYPIPNPKIPAWRRFVL